MRTDTQNAAILKALLAGNTLTGLDALERFGTMKLSTRCSELIRQGHPIQKQMVTLPNGKKVCRYWMLPDAVQRAA